MPELGEQTSGKTLGHKNSCRYIWSACSQCGDERWVQKHYQDANPEKLCRSCATALGSGGKRGRIKRPDGYFLILLRPSDFFYPMAKQDGYVLEHRLLMAKYLGRSLQPWEIVHHKNHIRDDNRLENLQLISDGGHKGITLLETKIDGLIKAQQNLKLEIRLLRLENKRLSGITNTEGGENHVGHNTA